MENENIMENAELLLLDKHGIYIPKIFAEAYPQYLSTDQQRDLNSPDNCHYWETWEDVLNTVRITVGGKIHSLHHDGDLWAIPVAELDNLENVQLLIQDRYGSYIPKTFAERYPLQLTPTQRKVLDNPYDTRYWETWERVLDTVTIEIDGKPHTLHQDGDLWAIPAKID
ncbi:hypothetical protein PV783_33910 [Chitinophaga sp. CC14]|uniref:hypothetical protein n=1 Tax=Chitinophaga sp. CC14 TaxID=3029199 RepID=UPI003B802C20